MTNTDRFACCAVLLAASVGAHAAPKYVQGPPGSVAYGTLVVVLATGRFVVTDPAGGPVPGAGAVHLHEADGRRVSTLTGTRAGDRVGWNVVALPDGDFVVLSPQWDRGDVEDAGAATVVDGRTGLEGRVTEANSLVGSSAFDNVGLAARVLAHGDVVVASPYWNARGNERAGAVTWLDARSPTTGPVSASNSLTGVATDDRLGDHGVAVLPNGNYLVRSPAVARGGASAAGAITWADGRAGARGSVHHNVSLFGTQAGERIGGPGFGALPVEGALVVLPDGNALVTSPHWNGGAGAVTVIDADTGVAGVIGPHNSLVGGTPGDGVGSARATLPGGTFVFVSPQWSAGPDAPEAGAVTWFDPRTPLHGVVSPENSLVGSQEGDRVGARGVATLANGHYVACSPWWNDGERSRAGAATWGDGARGVRGAVSRANSLVGREFDGVCDSVTPLANGHYVVASPDWDDTARGHADAGAATWADGTVPTSAVVSAATSLTGPHAEARIGTEVTALADGAYAVGSPHVRTSGGPGAVTRVAGDGPHGGTVSVANSLVGTESDPTYGTRVLALDHPDGRYLVVAPWQGPERTLRGAIALGRGAALVGPLSDANALVGSVEQPFFGAAFSVTPLPGGNYVVADGGWDDGANVDAGVAAWIDGAIGRTGVLGRAAALAGARAHDRVGVRVQVLASGDAAVFSTLGGAGALTWMSGRRGLAGTVSAANSLVGLSSDGPFPTFFLRDVAPHAALAFGATYDAGALEDAGLIAWFRTDRPTFGVVGPLTSVVGAARGGGAQSVARDRDRGRVLVGLPASNRVAVYPLPR